MYDTGETNTIISLVKSAKILGWGRPKLKAIIDRLGIREVNTGGRTLEYEREDILSIPSRLKQISILTQAYNYDPSDITKEMILRNAVGFVSLKDGMRQGIVFTIKDKSITQIRETSRIGADVFCHDPENVDSFAFILTEINEDSSEWCEVWRKYFI